MTTASKLDKELKAALKGPTYYERFMKFVRSIAEPLGYYV